MASEHKTVGVIGGMGPDATVLLMQKVLRAVPAKDDADHIPLIVHQNPAVPSRIAALIDGTGADPAPVLSQMARDLQAAGATALVMPCNTAHHYAGAICDATDLPFLNMLDLTAQHLARAGAKRIGLLASPAVRLTGVFDAAFAKQGLTQIYPVDDAPVLGLIRAVKAGHVLKADALRAPAGALLDQDALLEATLDLARFQSGTARDIAKIGMANYFAGAVQMPYTRFAEAAARSRHDLERLSILFGASIEQVAHRLSTLQRPGAKGIPFFFVRVDQAGTITKRHSATRLQFARFGGACPLWNVHRAFETPGRFLRQLAETPDGVRYLCLAREISTSGAAFRAPVRRFAIALGCEISHAAEVVYSDGLDLKDALAFEPIGISCRICARRNCHQRSVPPLESNLTVPHDRRETLPYEVSG